MSSLLHELPHIACERSPHAVALQHDSDSYSYSQLQSDIYSLSSAFITLGLRRQDRIAIFLPKQYETVASIFAASAAGCVFVPINPLLKAAQVQHILRDCSVRVLITTHERVLALKEILPTCSELQHLVLTRSTESHEAPLTTTINTWHWNDLIHRRTPVTAHRVIDSDMAAILYTSGSTGKPKGVVLSHRNLVTGAHSVASYLENTAEDKLLAVLPLSFDYGLSQLTTAFHVGASVHLMEYLFPKDIPRRVAEARITGLAGVPPLWCQLAELNWPDAATQSLRYITNSGGTLPSTTLDRLRQSLPHTKPFLMYGLTEAFRSTYLPPEQIDHRQGSIGKAIPNAEILVVKPDGSPCAPHEPGELVHRGSLVAMGYWNNAEKTAERFKPVPTQNSNLPLAEMAVWSGDTVKMDEDGYLYFIGRNDEMIKTSGYRVSPNEIEEILMTSGLVSEVVAVGITHPTLGQVIAVAAVAAPSTTEDKGQLLRKCKEQLPAFMVPTHIEFRMSLPRNQNGKYDRVRLALELSQS